MSILPRVRYILTKMGSSTQVGPYLEGHVISICWTKLGEKINGLLNNNMADS